MRLLKTALLVIAFTVSGAGHAAISIDINTSDRGATINKNIYGQFAEHLGRLFYDGIWVGPESGIPNTRGWRNDTLEALQALRVPVVRWPGGCFADEYNWRDGVGPRDQRPVTVNTLWGGVQESNAVGTHEFFDLVELLGAEAYVNGNLATGTPREMAQWMEYMTSESPAGLAKLRRENGRDKPFRVQHFGVGNESWGCGGHMSPRYYTDLYKRYTTMVRPPWNTPTKFVASGGHGYGDAIDDSGLTEWTDYLTKNIEPNFLIGFDAVSFHYYTHPKGSVMQAKGAATGFSEDEWMSTLAATLKMDEFLAANKAVMDKNDPEGKVGLYVDEWGTWYDPEPDTNPAFLSQQNSLRDAVVAALNFNIFHKHADRVQMTNIAQMVNVLQAMILTRGDQMILTPTYHAYKMYVPFQEATSLPTKLRQVPKYKLGKTAIPAVSASSARAADGRILLALVNTHPENTLEIIVALDGKRAQSATGEVLTASEMDAHNTYATPQVVAPKTYNATATEGGLLLEVPAKSVLVVTIQ